MIISIWFCSRRWTSARTRWGWQIDRCCGRCGSAFFFFQWWQWSWRSCLAEVLLNSVLDACIHLKVRSLNHSWPCYRVAPCCWSFTGSTCMPYPTWHQKPHQSSIHFALWSASLCKNCTLHHSASLCNLFTLIHLFVLCKSRSWSLSRFWKASASRPTCHQTHHAQQHQQLPPPWWHHDTKDHQTYCSIKWSKWMWFNKMWRELEQVSKPRCWDQFVSRFVSFVILCNFPD